MAQEDEDVKKKIEDSAREAESVMQKAMDKTLHGEVESGEPEEVEETAKKADSTTSIESQKTPEDESATKTPTDEEKPSTEDLPETTTTIEETKEVPKVEEKPKDEVIEEIKSVKLNKDAHPKTKKAFDKVKGIGTREHELRLAAEKRAKDLEDEKSKLKLLDEPTEKELHELRTFRKQLDIEHDPEFTQKYDQRIQSHGKTAQDIFAASPGVSPGTAKFIADNGGPLAFRSSSELMPVGMKDAQGNAVAQHEDGSPFTKREFWAKLMEPFLPPDAVKKINFFDNDSTRLEMERQQEIDKAKANVGEYEQSRQSKAQASAQEFQDRVKKRAEVYIKTLGEVAEKKEYPASATKEQIEAVDKHNWRRDRAEKQFQADMSSITPELITDMALDHAHVYILKEDNKELKSEAGKEKALRIAAEKRLEDFKNKGKTSTMQSAPAAKEKPKSQYGQDSETLMAERMKAAGL